LLLLAVLPEWAMAVDALVVSVLTASDWVVVVVVEEVPERVVQELKVSIQACRYLVSVSGNVRAEITQKIPHR
jgi:hypothetical protein